MQDQGKRLLLAVALALGVLFLWNTLTQKDEPPKDQASGEKAPPPGSPQVGATGSSAQPVAPMPRSRPRG